MTDVLYFENSMALVDQPPLLRERMARDGYLWMHGLLPVDAVREVYDAIMALCQQAVWADHDGHAQGQPRLEGNPDYWEVYDPVQRLEVFHALAQRPEILQVVERIVQEPVLAHPRNIARISFPHAERYTTPPHQDYIHIQGIPETYTAWIPLGDCPQELGGLAVLAGSHTRGVLPVHLADGAGGLGVDTDDLGLAWRTVDYQAGDVLLFHSLCVHKALPNRTENQLRLSTDFRYQGISQPLVEDSLATHFGRLEWEDVYKGWKRTELQYYWRNLPLRFVPRDHSYVEQAQARAETH